MIRHAEWKDLPHILRCEQAFPRRIRWTLDGYVRGGYECRVSDAGAIWFGQTGERLEIVSVAVTAPGQGQGRALMEAAHAWGRQRGLRKAFLDVLEHNTRARGLYTKLGYRVVGRTVSGALRMQAGL